MGFLFFVCVSDLKWIESTKARIFLSVKKNVSVTNVFIRVEKNKQSITQITFN